MKDQVLGKKSLTQRYPRLLVSIGTIFGLCIIFNKPIFDVCVGRIAVNKQMPEKKNKVHAPNTT